jgi:excisionase family DNA binding protein
MSRRKTPTTVQPQYLSIPEVAIMLGLGRTKVYDLIKHEGLPVARFGDLKRVPVAKLQRWLEQREQPPF